MLPVLNITNMIADMDNKNIKKLISGITSEISQR